MSATIADKIQKTNRLEAVIFVVMKLVLIASIFIHVIIIYLKKNTIKIFKNIIKKFT
jgi:Na+-transporting NADH:ubiquinone oxidoreductase subunit NqrC